MNEVLCKAAFPIFARALKRKGVTFSSIVEGTNVTAEILTDRKARIDWADYVAVMRNVRQHFTDDEYVALGREWMHQPALKFVFTVARLMFGPLDFYRWLNKPRNGVGNQFFTCIVPTHREPEANHVQMELMVSGDHEIVWDFFLITKGNMEELPKLLGLARAEVTLTRLPRGAQFDIAVPSGLPLFSRIRRALMRPFVRRDAAKELKAAHESLIERFYELESAQQKLDRQATQLRTAHSINVLVQRDIDVTVTLATVARALVEEAGFAWASVTVQNESASFGEPSNEVQIKRGLEGRGGESVGELVVMPKDGENAAEREELLSFITPSLAIALQNAIYRGGLEELVHQRTEDLVVARDQLSATVDALKDAQGAREKFFGNISHEIRTPLSIIMLAVKDIERRALAQLDSRATAGLGSIHDSAKKLLQLVDELLLLAAGQEDRLQLAPEPTDMAAMVTAIVNAWTPVAEDAGLTISASISAPVTMKVDPVALERVISNLVSNAVKYTKTGAVALELAHDGEHVRISVLDTGLGISEDLRSRLFGRFERAQGEHRKISGTGIGLSLVKALTEQHGGTVAAHDRPAGGTEMRVLLPASLIVEAKKQGIQLRLVEQIKPLVVKQRVVTGPADLAKGTILIAEDDVRLADMIAEMLSDEYVVRVANDGESALAMAKEHHPELLITDVDMPGMNGIELAQRFRETSNNRLAPVIILSAVLDLGTRVAGLEAGAVDYVTKPFDPAELRARVRSQFRQRDMAMRLHRAEQLSTLGVLTSGLAHELRNPANGVVNAMEPIRMLIPPELMKPGEPLAELIEVAIECAEQIKTVSRQLLGFRDAESTLELRPTHVGEIVDRAFTLTRTALEGVEVRVKVDKTLQINCAPSLLTQVFTNLFENAGHAAGRGGWVEVSTVVAAGRVAVTVADSGPGVPVPMRARIFEPFFTTKPQGVGTGLGLPVSREISVRHGGALEVQDRGHGSVFVVDLPLLSTVDLTAHVG